MTDLLEFGLQEQIHLEVPDGDQIYVTVALSAYKSVVIKETEREDPLGGRNAVIVFQSVSIQKMHHLHGAYKQEFAHDQRRTHLLEVESFDELLGDLVVDFDWARLQADQ